MAEKIGFVGVGRMGGNMARRLKDCGYEIAAVYDVNTAAAQALAQDLGCPAAETLQQVTKLSDVVITVVTDDKAMKKIYNGGMMSRARGKLFINCATITPDVHVWVEARPERARSPSCAAASPKCSSAPNRFWKSSAPQCATSAPPVRPPRSKRSSTL